MRFINRTLFAAVFALALASPAAALDQVQGKTATPGAAATQATQSNSAVVEKGITTTTITVPASSEPQEFKVDLKPVIDGLLPYIIAAVGGLISVLASLLTLWLKQKFNIEIQAKDREAFQQSATNAAGALIARGAVSVEANVGTITVDSAAMARVIDTVSQRVPEAITRLGVTPDQIHNLIIAKLPQVLTGSTPAATTAKV